MGIGLRVNRRLLPALVVGLAVALLAMTIRWQIPMMLWDHLDLVPMYRGWLDGDLSGTGFLDIHGGHLHTSAYAVLLATTWLADGQPWLDGVVSWLLLIAYAAMVLRFLRSTGTTASPPTPGILLAAIALMCLYPGHLANLQWGWQVAVFLCMAGVAATIALLTRPVLGWSGNALALLSCLVAMTSFATGIAMAPVAVLLIALRRELPRGKRLWLTLPWLLLMGGFLWKGLAVAGQSGAGSIDPVMLAVYALNVIGAGIARFATAVAPWLALLAMLALIPMLYRLRGDRRALPWIGLVVFAVLAAIAIAWGRAMPFGTDHAFATRYVSFSSMFWLGWLGLFRLSCLRGWLTRTGTIRAIAGLIVVFAGINAVNMIGKAARLSGQTGEIAASIREQFPAIDPALLREIYFDQPQIAIERIRTLHELGFPPFRRIDPGTGGNEPPSRSNVE